MNQNYILALALLLSIVSLILVVVIWYKLSQLQNKPNSVNYIDTIEGNSKWRIGSVSTPSDNYFHILDTSDNNDRLKLYQNGNIELLNGKGMVSTSNSTLDDGSGNFSNGDNNGGIIRDYSLLDTTKDINDGVTMFNFETNPKQVSNSKSLRWSEGLSDNETGDTSGSNFNIWAYKGGGDYLNTYFKIARSTGKVETLNNTLDDNGMIGIGTKTPHAMLNVVSNYEGRSDSLFIDNNNNSTSLNKGSALFFRTLDNSNGIRNQVAIISETDTEDSSNSSAIIGTNTQGAMTNKLIIDGKNGGQVIANTGSLYSGGDTGGIKDKVGITNTIDDNTHINLSKHLKIYIGETPYYIPCYN